MKNVLNVDTVSDYLNLRKQEVLHPLVGIVDFKKVSAEGHPKRRYDAFHFGCYAIFLKDATGCKMRYGGKSYDYDEGTLVFIGPNQTIELTNYDPGFKPEGYALLFHPDLLWGTDMGKKMHGYSFFSYAANEALHLSVKERKVIISLLDKIQFELEQTIDRHSKKLIVANIELFLDYCVRFYDRQFITRESVNLGIVENFKALLDDYFMSEKPQKQGTPSVSYFAETQHLSSNYFGDLIKKETGKSAHDHIQTKLIEVAKERIIDHDKSLSEIAFELGFKYPQHFTRLFKNKVGYTPYEYRMLG